MKCGKHSHSELILNRLAELGKALDASLTLSVFTDGFVGFCDEDESEVIKHVAGKEGRSAARSRSGQGSAERPWRSAGEAHRFRSGSHEEAFGAGFRILAQQYGALAFEDPNGLWVVVRCNPLGGYGPQIHFLIGLPIGRDALPRAWAFERIGPRASLMSLKHTNFPDASICAFLPDEGAWSWSDGLISLVDHYAVWAIKKLHHEAFGHWPGKQAGVCAYYRRREFAASEWCGCQSGKRYKDCHQGSDLLVDERFGLVEFRRYFRVDYDERAAPLPVIDAARTRWIRLPDLGAILGARQTPT